MPRRQTNYNSWTRTGLIQRVTELEAQLETCASSLPAASPQRGASPSHGGHTAPGPSASKVAATAAEPSPPSPSPSPAKKQKRRIDPSRYATRYIALKLAYLGKRYGGFEFQAMGNEPSIEEELWRALTKACLIFPEDERVVQFDCCEYSKCGRTDRGVSAFGQVVGLRVRSNRPLPEKPPGADASDHVPAAREDAGRANRSDGSTDVTRGDDDAHHRALRASAAPFNDLQDELCYPRILNRILPSDIRILAWCPSPPPGFSARFSCRERQYRYFFTQPAFTPQPNFLANKSREGGGGVVAHATAGKPPVGWLDVGAMRDAASRFEGEHDFRNVCKVDPAKQITNFRRRIFESDIIEVPDAALALPYLEDQCFAGRTFGSGGPYPKVYCFLVRGSAFLWHQIRHMIALLFLVGQGLESPSLVSELLDVEKNPRKPQYAMADEVPLVLWDCVFPRLKDDGAPTSQTTVHEDALDWIYVGDEHAPNKFGQFGVMDSVWELWRERQMDALLANQLLQKISHQGSFSVQRPDARHIRNDEQVGASARVFEGGNLGRLSGKYIPVMKELMQSPEEQNDRYAKRKGYVDADDMRAQRGIGQAAGDGADVGE